MEIFEEDGVLFLVKEGARIGRCAAEGCALKDFGIAPAWRRHGYGSFLLKEYLQRTGGYARGEVSLHTAPLPSDAGELCFWRKFGFLPEGGRLARRRAPDLTAVHFAQEFLAARCPAPAFCVDATCGNGGDTEFLCRLAARCGGHVLAMDLQPEACARTRARLEAAGLDKICEITCGSHAALLPRLAPGTADLVMFNFGWLPGAAHNVFSAAESSIPALEAALAALRPGGVLSAVLYSGKTIGSGEKEQVLAWLKTLPLARYTVLVCDFANWADTAPLPCFVLKRP